MNTLSPTRENTYNYLDDAAPDFHEPTPVSYESLGTDAQICEQFQLALDEKNYSLQRFCFDALLQLSAHKIDCILGGGDFSETLDAILDLAKNLNAFRAVKQEEIKRIEDQFLLKDEDKTTSPVQVEVKLRQAREKAGTILEQQIKLDPNYFPLYAQAIFQKYSTVNITLPLFEDPPRLCLQITRISPKDEKLLFSLFDKTVRCLDIDELHMTEIPCDKIMEVGLKICRLLQNSRTNVRCMRIGSCGITNEIFSVLAPVLTASGIEELFLDDNKLTKNANVAQLLRCPSLISLSLCNNPLKSGEIAKIAEALRENTTLKWLRLGEISLNTKGFELLARALEHNVSLTTLSLRGNQLDNNIIPALRSLLKTKSSAFKYLDIGHNELDTLGIKRICQLFERIKPTGFTLEIEGNTISPQMKIKWDSLKEKNSPPPIV